MARFSPQEVSRWIGLTFPGLRITQIKNLGSAVFGMVKRRTAIISDLVRDPQIPGSHQHKHRRKKLDRFLVNHLVSPQRLFGYWIAWVMAVLVRGKYVPIAIDWTTLPGGRQCLMAAVPLLGRGIPLMWYILPTWVSIKDSQNRIEERFISRLLTLLPFDKIPIILADRGFGRADLVKFLLKKGCYLFYGLRLT